MGIVSWLIVGLIAGWLAGVVMKGGGYGLVGDIVLGIVGALLGGFLAVNFFGLSGVSGINVESIVVAFVGAVIVLFAARLLRGRRAF
jgi:uncharacterized membrane protein YeaQ/YmgE (transglycosylase-associated protein family)